MTHTIRDKQKLLARIRRLRGQIEAMERAVESEAGCEQVMHLIAGIRGSTTGLMAEIMEDHVRAHFGASKEAPEAADQVIDVIRAYLK